MIEKNDSVIIFGTQDKRPWAAGIVVDIKLTKQGIVYMMTAMYPLDGEPLPEDMIGTLDHDGNCVKLLFKAGWF